MAGQRTVKIPDIEHITEVVTKHLPVVAYSGVLILRDVISDQDSETGLIVSLDSGNLSLKTSNRSICSGTVVSIAPDFMKQYIGDYDLHIGERVIANINNVIPINLANYDGTTYNLLMIREEDILAVIEPDVVLKVI